MDEPKACEKVIAQVSAVLDGETSAVERIRWKAHLAVCPSCKRYVHQLQVVTEAAAVVIEEDRPTDFDRVLRLVLQKVSAADGQDAG